jgi:hypothetical protein
MITSFAMRDRDPLPETERPLVVDFCQSASGADALKPDVRFMAGSAGSGMIALSELPGITDIKLGQVPTPRAMAAPALKELTLTRQPAGQNVGETLFPTATPFDGPEVSGRELHRRHPVFN